MPPRNSPVVRRYRFGRVLTSDLGFEAHRPPGEREPARFRPVSKGLPPTAVEDGLLPNRSSSKSRCSACKNRRMDPSDLELRNRTYAQFVELGRAPAAEEAGPDPAEVRRGWQRLHDAHALVLDEATGAIRMANPFSAVATPYRVHADGRWWYANCAWDAFGIAAALHCDATIETACPDCGDPLTIDVRDGAPSREDLVFHCLVAAAHWWDDIGFT